MKFNVSQWMIIIMSYAYSYDIEPGCLNTQSGGIESNKILRVVEQNGGEMTVTVTNSDGDGYLAIPDAHAGKIDAGLCH